MLHKEIRFKYFLRPLVDCRWGEWKLGECSTDCGGGMRTDARNIEIKAAHGGGDCEGESNITEKVSLILSDLGFYTFK